MASRWLTTVLCLLMLLGVCVSVGCSPERNARRVHVMRTDLNHMVDDIDWFFGLDEPSILYEYSFPPGP